MTEGEKLEILRGNPCISDEECIRVNCPDCAHPVTIPGAHLCSRQHEMTRNPHPDAGRPEHYLQVGAEWECIPCLVAGRHYAIERYQSAERQLEESDVSWRRAWDLIEELRGLVP